MAGPRCRPRARAGPASAAAALAPALLLLLLFVDAVLLGPRPARGQGSAPGSPSAPATAPAAELAAPPAGIGRAPAAANWTAAPDGPAGLRASPAPIPDCGLLFTVGEVCTFTDLSDKSQAKVEINATQGPTVTVISTLESSYYESVAFGSNQLRKLMENTFPADSNKPGSYATPVPEATFTVTTPDGRTRRSGTAELINSREESIRSSGGEQIKRYTVKVKQGGGQDSVGDFPRGSCSMVVRAACPICPVGETNFGSGCVDAGCAFTCGYSDKTCVAGSICPRGTVVSAACADRSAFKESPCACTALQQLAALSPTLQEETPWSALADFPYCLGGSLKVVCKKVDGVQLPLRIIGQNVDDLAGPMPPSVGDLKKALERVDLRDNAISTVPSQIAMLAKLTSLNLGKNVFSSVPTEFQTFSPSNTCLLNSDGFSCANVGFGTSCCNAANCGDTSTCSGAPPAPEPCNPSDTSCDAGGACPGGTLVSAECADRSDFSESPCACTALQELAALSSGLQTVNPWKNLANKPYCQTGSLEVGCTADGAIQVPGSILGIDVGLAGALPPSLGELTSLSVLDLPRNALTSVPTEIGALGPWVSVSLAGNSIAELPTEFRSVSPTGPPPPGTDNACELEAQVGDPGGLCDNVGVDTSCCTDRNCGSAFKCFVG